MLSSLPLKTKSDYSTLPRTQPFENNPQNSPTFLEQQHNISFCLDGQVSFFYHQDHKQLLKISPVTKIKVIFSQLANSNREADLVLPVRVFQAC